jgi:aminoglycoside 3-N-acetyltransferase
MPASFSDLKPALSDLSLSKRLVLVHASPAVNADELLSTLLETTSGFITPTFTPKSLLPLEYHPVHPKVDVSSATPFHPAMPTDEAVGNFAELVRQHPKAERSLHPVFSFAGIHADALIHAQTDREPYAPIASLAEQDGVILLIGMDQRVNFSIHYGEKLAGRMQFIRWALTENGIAECPNFPGDSEGFNTLASDLKSFTRRADVNGMAIQAIPVNDLLRAVVNKIHSDPYTLLCSDPTCERCEAVRWG